MTEIAAFVAGIGIALSTVILGDNLMSWYLFRKCRRLERELELEKIRHEREIDSLREWLGADN